MCGCVNSVCNMYRMRWNTESSDCLYLFWSIHSVVSLLLFGRKEKKKIENRVVEEKKLSKYTFQDWNKVKIMKDYLNDSIFWKISSYFNLINVYVICTFHFGLNIREREAMDIGQCYNVFQFLFFFILFSRFSV